MNPPAPAEDGGCGCAEAGGGSARRIRLLDGESAITVALAGMVVHGASYEIVKRYRADVAFRRTARGQDLGRALAHEYVHYLQAAGSAFLQLHGQLLFGSGIRLMAASPHDRVARRSYRAAKGMLTSRQTRARLSCLDLLEAGAVLGAHKMVEADWGRDPETADARARFARDLADLRATGGSHYHRAYDWLSDQLGEGAAYQLYAPISFMAFNTREPVKTFVRYVRRMRRDLVERVGILRDSVAEIVDGKLSPVRGGLWLDSATIWESYRTNPTVVHETLVAARYGGLRIVAEFGRAAALEILVRPWRLAFLELPPHLLDTVTAIATVWSSAEGLVQLEHSLGGRDGTVGPPAANHSC